MTTTELSIPPVKQRKATDKGREVRPVYSSPGRSALRHVRLVLVSVVLGLLVGGVVAYRQAPVWKAESRLIVGTTVNLTNPGATPGLAEAEIQVASNYSRLVGTTAVSDGVRTRLGHPASGTLTATPVPLSAIILVDATGPTQSQATALANAGQAALVDAVNVVNRQTAAANTALLTQYQAAAQQMATDTVARDNLSQQQTLLQSEITGFQSSINSLSSSTNSATTDTQTRIQVFQSEIATNQQQLASLTPKLVAASAAVSVDNLKAQTIETQYSASYNPNLIAEQAISPLGAAAAQGSNRKSNLEIGLLAGGVGGLVIGIAIASLMDIRDDSHRRARRAR